MLRTGLRRAARFLRAAATRDLGRALRQTTRGPAPRALRVLYALQFFPHASETYIATEIAWMRRQGVEIEVWSEHDPPVPDVTDVVVHRGALAKAMASFDPQVIHGHHLEQALGYLPSVAAARLPMTIRAHGFELSEAQLLAIHESATIATVWHFPHLTGSASAPGAEKIRPMTCCFDPELYFSRGEKDRRLVVRTGLASPTKDLGMFIRLATRFPHHHFVLIPCWSFGVPGHLDELQALNRTLGAPVDIRPNLPRTAVAEIVRTAGISLHTHALMDAYGMPVSIAEAMATGCHVIARRTPASEGYLAGTGRLYDSMDEAAELLRETESWTDARWRLAQTSAVDRAYGTFAAPDVLRPLLVEWQRIAARGARQPHGDSTTPADRR